MTSNDFDQRLTSLETKLDTMNGTINDLTTTIEEAMKLFSHSESSVQLELTEKRFQSNLKNTAGIQSRYRTYPFSAYRVEG